MADKKISRKSPLGFTEYLDPKLNIDYANAYTAIGEGGQPEISYRPNVWDDPETQMHERIHAAQIKGIQILESTLKEQYLRDYIKNHPRPLVTPQIDMKQEGLFGTRY